MSDDFSFGFDLDALENDNSNSIPPAEDELKPTITAEDEVNPIHFVDARFYREEPDIFAQDDDNDGNGHKKQFKYMHSIDLDDDMMDSMLEIVDQFEPEYDDNDHINLSETHRNTSTSLSVNPTHNFRTSTGNDSYTYPMTSEELQNKLMFSDSEFESDFTDNDEYNFEEYIGLDQRILPFDFEKPLRWKPMSTVIVDLEIQQIESAISRTVQHEFYSDDESDDDSHSSSSSDDVEEIYTNNVINTSHVDDTHSSSSFDDNANIDAINIFYVDDVNIDAFEPMVSTSMNPKSSGYDKRFLSNLNPPLYDILLMESSPLRISDVDNINGINKISLEYLHCGLLDQDKLYEKIWQTLLRNSFNVRCGSLNGNITNIKRISKEGGCKILQFVAHCCNPIQVAKHAYSVDANNGNNLNNLNNIYCDLTKHITNPLDEEYILLESDAKQSIIDGEWIPFSEFKEYFQGNTNDIVIVMSPQHIEMAHIFLDMGYSYVIGIQTFDENNRNTQNNWQILDFIHHFYSAILNQERLCRAFELAKTATKSSQSDLKSKKEMAKITRKMQRLNGLILQKTQTEAIDDETEDERFVLLQSNAHAQPERFIVFSKLERGEPIDVTGNMSKHTKYATNWNNILMKPFIGRSHQVIHVYRALIHNKMILIAGRENDGRKSVIKRLISYLYQHNYFDDGLFVLDCKSELMHKKRYWKFKDILCFKLSQLGFDMDSNSQSNLKSQLETLSELNETETQRTSRKMPMTTLTNKMPMSFTNIDPMKMMKSITVARSTLRSSRSVIPTTPSMDDMIKSIEKYNICFVLFNVDCWDNDEIYHFMDAFASKNNNDKSQFIFTMQHGKHCHFNDNKSYKMQLSQIPTTLPNLPAQSHAVMPFGGPQSSIVDELLKGPQDIEYGISIVSNNTPQMDIDDTFLRMFEGKHSSFKIITIDALHREYITELFVQLCYYDFDQNIVKKHDRIHELFDGSPGNVKRVSAFYQFLKTQNDATNISLDSIVTQLNTTHCGWMNDFHKTCPKFTHTSSSLERLRSIHTDLEQHRTIPIAENLCYGTTMQIPKASKSRLQFQISQVVATSSRQTPHSGYSDTRIHTDPEQNRGIPNAENLYYGTTVQIPKASKSKLQFQFSQLAATNSPPTPYSDYSDTSTTPMIMEEIELPDTICMIKNAKALQDLYPMLERIPFCEVQKMMLRYYDNDITRNGVIIHDEHNEVISKSGKAKSAKNLKESVTEELSMSDVTSEYEDDNGNQGFDSIWNNVANKNNIINMEYANLKDFQSALADKFHNITKLNKIELNEKQIESCFKYATNDRINDNCNILIKQFKIFWKWFISMCYIVADLYQYVTSGIVLDIFYDKMDAQKQLKNEDIGTFMFILGPKCNELIIIYNTQTKEIHELLLTRSRKDHLYITNNNKKYNIFKYIQNHSHLKQFLSTKHGTMDKKHLFSR